MTVHEFIKENWINTVNYAYGRENHPLKDLDRKFTVPCIDTLFIDFFYWDTYFTNIGLIIDGLEDQAQQNLDVMKYLCDKYGYIPNADHILTRSQPPFFTRAIYDYYIATNDKELLKKYLPSAITELKFWDKHRKTSIGLNAYGNCETKEGIDWYYKEFDHRLQYSKTERELDKTKFCCDLLAIAESGWDFNLRFLTDKNRFATYSFAHLDLNCILYDAEVKLSSMLKTIGENEQSDGFAKKAKQRKDLINKYLFDKEKGIYLDYNFVDNSFSRVVSAASFYPYAFGVSDDAEGAKKVFEKLNLKFGISAGEYLGDQIKYFQWDYPNMWPTNVYVAYNAMKNVRLYENAEIIKNEYISTVDNVFNKTGKLWEKYNAATGDVSITEEYETPPMMGWTAGVYNYLINE